MHSQGKILLANRKLISTLNCCVRYHNTFSDHKFDLLKDVSNKKTERQHAKHVLQLSAWYKKQM